MGFYEDLMAAQNPAPVQVPDIPLSGNNSIKDTSDKNTEVKATFQTLLKLKRAMDEKAISNDPQVLSQVLQSIHQEVAPSLGQDEFQRIVETFKTGTDAMTAEAQAQNGTGKQAGQQPTGFMDQIGSALQNNPMMVQLLLGALAATSKAPAEYNMSGRMVTAMRSGQELALERERMAAQEREKQAALIASQQNAQLASMQLVKVAGPDGKPTYRWVSKGEDVGGITPYEKDSTAGTTWFKMPRGGYKAFKGDEIPPPGAIPVSTANTQIRVETFGTTPTSTPGIAYDKVRRVWFKTDASGNRIQLSSDDVKNLTLQYKEEIPTNDIKVMQQSVPSVLQLIKQSREALTKASTGPLAGRWADFWSGKVGATNPEFRTLKVDVGLLQTRLMKMHVGARGGEYIMKHFNEMIDAGKDSPANMSAALDAMEQYANEVGMTLDEQKGNANKISKPSYNKIKVDPSKVKILQ